MAKQVESLLSAENIAALESFAGQSEGYFGRMIDYLDEFIQAGIAEGRFTEEEASSDLQIALWYGYAYNNLDDYEAYYIAADIMAKAEKNAAGCGTWYYRYAYALMYCGKLELAQRYAEQGAQEEPDYPWIWLPVAKLRSHFGDKQGALEAVAKGLALEPDDYEFITLQQEIEQDCSLEQMEYHYINEENDKALLNGTIDAETCYSKRKSLAGLVCDRQALMEIQMRLQASNWRHDTMYCHFEFPLLGRSVEGCFVMNEAAVSKLNPEWIDTMLQMIQDEDAKLRTRLREDGYGENELTLVMFFYDESMELSYYNAETDETRRIAYNKKKSSEQIEQDMNNGMFPTMFKLYLQEDDGLHYAECWLDEEDGLFEVNLHKGTVGDMGMHQTVECASLDEYQNIAAEFFHDFNALGYHVWSEVDMEWMVVQFPVTSADRNEFQPTQEDTELREAAFYILNETLGWNGLGHVDGWEMGRNLATPEENVLNLYCCTVDAERSVGLVLQALEAQLDCSRMKIAVRSADEEMYGLVYAADCSDTFSL